MQIKYILKLFTTLKMAHFSWSSLVRNLVDLLGYRQGKFISLTRGKKCDVNICIGKILTIYPTFIKNSFERAAYKINYLLKSYSAFPWSDKRVHIQLPIHLM